MGEWMLNTFGKKFGMKYGLSAFSSQVCIGKNTEILLFYKGLKEGYDEEIDGMDHHGWLRRWFANKKKAHRGLVLWAGKIFIDIVKKKAGKSKGSDLENCS